MPDTSEETTTLVDPVIELVMAVLVNGEVRHRIPLERAMKFFATALREHNGDTSAASAALERALGQVARS